MVVKVKILSQCKYCGGQAYLPAGMDVDSKGEKYMRFLPCPSCKGSGLSGTWITLSEFKQLLGEYECAHEHVSRTGGPHFSAGEVWDDIEEVCDDCGKSLD